MLRFLAINYQILTLFILWMVTGIYLPVASYFIIPASIIILNHKNMLLELILGFLLILILDDNTHNDVFTFTPVAKQIYILTLAVIFFLFYYRFHPVSNLFLWFIPYFIVAFIATILFTPTFYDGMKKGLSYFLLLLIIPNFITRLFRERKAVIFKELFYFVMLILIAGFIMWFIHRDFVLIKGRYCGLFGNPNGMGIFCTLAFVLFELVIEYFPRLFSRTERYIFYFLLFGSLILTASRTAYLSFAIFFIFRFFHRVSPIISIAMLLTIFIGYELIVINLLDIVRFFGLERYFRIQTLMEGGGRIVAWKFAWDEINNMFLMGRGFNYDVFYFRSHYAKLVRLGHEGLVHNSYLSLWLNSGIIGLMLFISALAALFAKASRNSRLAVPVIYTVITSSFFESWLIASLNPFTVVFWIILTVLTTEEFHAGEQTIPVSVQ